MHVGADAARACGLGEIWSIELRIGARGGVVALEVGAGEASEAILRGMPLRGSKSRVAHEHTKAWLESSDLTSEILLGIIVSATSIHALSIAPSSMYFVSVRLMSSPIHPYSIRCPLKATGEEGEAKA